MLKLTQSKAFSKKDAHAALLGFLNRADERIGGSIEVDYATLERLFKMTLPAQPKIAKTAFDWVAKACGKRDYRPALNYVCVNDGTIYGSDGSRVHWANTDLTDGLYDPKSGVLSDSTDKYPDVQRVIDSAFKGSSPLGDTVMGETPTIVNGRISVYPVGDIHVQASFLDAAMNGAESVELNSNTASKFNPVWGNSEHGTFVIMPIDISKVK